ncbi:helix-turn-helix transcriptional regulator [Tropicibacter sp. Alg240-R139]|uniref:helix-turn-helix transcriptional regulator n=1 Tax=Tropicibacter sp. Alg240-R139 TaxID=2305991 RepID=UPI0013DF367D|nr:helix-turn-helix transcriptional regulator [Tropicibacter sp. Alg240-R139]
MSVTHQEFADFGQTASAFGGWDLETVQVDTGPTTSIVKTRRLPDMELLFNQETHGGVSDWLIEKGKTTVAFYHPSMMPGAWCGHEVGPDDMLVTSSDRDHFARTPHNLSMVMLTAQTDLFDRYNALPCKTRGLVSSSTNAVVPLMRTGRQLRKLLFELMLSDRVEMLFDDLALQDEILCLLGKALDEANAMQQPRARPVAGFGLVQRAVRLANHSSDRIGASALASTLGVSLRVLDLAFRQELGISPGRYMLQQRLQCVRSEIIQANLDRTLIKQIAIRNGFSDLGRFAQYYRRMYGELPSQTLESN